MPSSNSVHHDKKPKKYQKFKNYQFKDITTSTGKIESENSKTAWKNEISVEKNSNEFINSKDFPELKIFNKHYSKSSHEKSSSETFTRAIRDQKKPVEIFPALLVTANHKSGEVNLIKNEEKCTKIISEENTSALSKTHPNVRFGIQGNANISINKGIRVSSSKKASVQLQKNFVKKKRTDPVLINFQDTLSFNKIQNKRKQYHTCTTKVQRLRHKDFLCGNFLDSSNPKRSRGKHREIKKKKLSTLKMTIIKERILKQKMKEIAVGTNAENICFNLINKIDFKSEIKIYLNKLNEIKIKDLENIKNKLKENSQVNNNNNHDDNDDVNNDNDDDDDVDEKQENLKTKLIEKKDKNSENISDVKEKKIQVFLQGEIKFSSKFREYCDNIITPDLNSAVTDLIKGLIKLQDRLFSRDPIKAKVKKRHVSGIREVRKYLTLKKVKMIIIAPNLEKLQMKGSIYDSINELKSMANAQNVTYGFALDRYKLGRCTKKNVPVSAFAVLNYEGVENLYGNAMHKLQEAKKKFSELTKPEKIENVEKTEDINSQVISSLISAFREDLRVSEKAESISN